MELFKSLENRTESFNDPFKYFEINQPLTDDAIKEISEDAMAVLQVYNWPGNVRQLRNVIEWVIIMASNNSCEIVNVEMLPPEFGSVAPVSLTSDKGIEIMGMALREAREHFEREYLMAQVDRFGGNISKTAVFIGMERSALHRKLKSLGVN